MSRILKDFLESAQELHEAGLMPLVTLKKIEKNCLPKVKQLTPKQIQRIRLSYHVSQAVFAAYLNTSASTVRKWEIGNKKPTGSALKLLNMVKEKGLEILA